MDTPQDYELLYKEMEVQDMVYTVHQLQDEVQELRDRLAQVEQRVQPSNKLVLLLVVVVTLRKLLF